MATYDSVLYKFSHLTSKMWKFGSFQTELTILFCFFQGPYCKTLAQLTPGTQKFSTALLKGFCNSKQRNYCSKLVNSYDVIWMLRNDNQHSNNLRLAWISLIGLISNQQLSETTLSSGLVLILKDSSRWPRKRKYLETRSPNSSEFNLPWNGWTLLTCSLTLVL